MHALVEGCQLACALPNGREAAYDQRASCFFYVEGARPPEAFHANITGTKSWAARSRPSRFGHVNSGISVNTFPVENQASRFALHRSPIALRVSLVALPTC